MSRNTDIIKRAGLKATKAVDNGVGKALDILEREIPEQIKKRTRLGGGVQTVNNEGFGGRRTKLDSLSESYKKKRKLYKSNLSSQTSPSKSNLTATGQLLDSIKSRKRPGDKLDFKVTGSRRKELDGSKSNKTNEQVRKYVEEKREFLGLTNAEVNKFTRLARKIIEKELSKVLK